MAERFQSKDFEWVVMAINIQRRVGGNLAELLKTVAAHHARARVHAPPGRRARGGGQALGVSCSVVCRRLFLLYLMLTKGDYVSVLFTAPAGMADARRWSGHPVGVGAFWMSRIIKVEV